METLSFPEALYTSCPNGVWLPKLSLPRPENNGLAAAIKGLDVSKSREGMAESRKRLSKKHLCCQKRQ